MREPALGYLTIDGAGPIEQIVAAAAGGFASPGLRIRSPTHLRDRIDIVGRPDLTREAQRALAAHGIAGFDAEVITLAPTTRAGDHAPFLATAAELGCRFVQVVCEDADESRARDNLAALAEAAARHGLAVAIEFMAFRAWRSLEQAAALVAAIDRPGLGVVIDALHLARSGGTLQEVAALPRRHLAYAQICDAPAAAPADGDLAREARYGRLHCGEGGLDLRSLLAALPADAPLSVEVPHAALAGRPFAEKARIAGDAARRFLATVA